MIPNIPTKWEWYALQGAYGEEAKKEAEKARDRFIVGNLLIFAIGILAIFVIVVFMMLRALFF